MKNLTKKYSERHPPHIFKENTIYFLTVRTIDKNPYFDSDQKKDIIKSCLKAGLRKHAIKIFAWVILNNHYHLLIKITNKDDLPNFLKTINGKSSFELNKTENKQNRKIWHNYWDRCIRAEKDFWMRFNYIHNNPIKHGYIKNPDKLREYKFSSHNQWVKRNGAEWITSCFAKYPIIDFSTPDDD